MMLAPSAPATPLPQPELPEAIKAGVLGMLTASAVFWLVVFLIGIARTLFGEPLVIKGPITDGPIQLPRPPVIELALSMLNTVLAPAVCGAVVAWRLPHRAWVRAAVIAGVMLVLTYYLGSVLLAGRLGAPRRVGPEGLVVGSLLFALTGGLLAAIGGALVRRWWQPQRSDSSSLPGGLPAATGGPRPYATPEAAARFAHEWIEAWNSHDLTRILEHYRDDFEMSSPLIIQRGFSPDGVLRGKAVIADYWKIGLAAQPPLKFELIEVFRGAGMIGLLYRNVTRNRRVIEWFRFDEAGLVSHAAGIYGEPG